MNGFKKNKHWAVCYQRCQVFRGPSENFCTKLLTVCKSYFNVNPRLVWGFSVQAPIRVNVPVCILQLRFTFIFVLQTRAQ